MSSTIRAIETAEALASPAFSQALRAGDLLFVSGQVGLPAHGGPAPERLEEEIDTALDGLEAVLRAAGAGLSSVVRTSCYLRDINDLAAFNEIYLRRFHAPLPARTTVQATLALGLRFEIDAVATLAP